ncbi:MAG: M20/M25/M40 family metallo-hydrolase [Thermoanaerobaculia bacterium]
MNDVRKLFAALALLAVMAVSCRRGRPAERSLELPDWQPEMARTPARWLEEEPIRLLRDYVRIDTRNPPGRERPGAEFLKRYLDCEGIPSELICPDRDRCNLYSRLPGRSRNKAILLLNHIDVVPVADSLWTKPPFGGTIEKSYLYGRGSYDMKSIAISQLLAYVDLFHSGLLPDRDVVFLAECGEELGGTDGVPWIYEHRPDVLAGVDLVLNEGGYEEVVAGVPRYIGIEVGQGGMAYAILGSDDPAVLRPEETFRSLDLFVPPAPALAQFFDAISEFRPPFFANAFRHPELLKLPEVRKWIPYQNLSLVTGGIWRQPPFEGRLLPEFSGGYQWGAVAMVSLPLGVDPKPYFTPLLERLESRGAHVIFSLCGPPGTASPFPTADTNAIRRVLQAVAPGVPVIPLVNSFSGTTSLEFRKRGVPAYGFTPFQIDPFDAARRHGNDERIFLPFYTRGVGTMREVLFEVSGALTENRASSNQELTKIVAFSGKLTLSCLD